MVLVADDDDRENEGDVVVAAEFATPETINFMAQHGRGLICVAISPEIAERFSLEPMVRDSQDEFGTAFTVSVDGAPRFGVTTGISAEDRAATVRVLLDTAEGPDALRRPGHMFPLVAQSGGVLVRRGHTEASTDLCMAAGLRPAAVIVEVLRRDGRMARKADLDAFALEHRMVSLTVEDIVAVRTRAEYEGFEVEAIAS